MAVTGEISEIINSFREISGVGVCFYDLEDFFRYSSTGERENVGHYCEFCKAVRLLDGGRALCMKSDARDAVDAAHVYKAPFFTSCHIGLCELVVPIYDGDELRGVIFFGQCRIENEDASEKIFKAAEALGGDGREFARMYRELPVVSRNALVAMGSIMRLYFKNLTVAGAAKNDGAAEQGLPLAHRVAAYIERCYMSAIGLNSVSKAFYLNRSYIAREFKKEFGVTVTEYINAVRVDNAKKFLSNPRVTVKNVALNVGFSDANYFSRVFTKIAGVTPTEYRNGKNPKVRGE